MPGNTIEVLINAKDNASKKIEGVTDTLNKLGVVAAAGAVAKFAVELGQLGQQSQAAEARFQAFAGSAQKADAILRTVTATTGGTVDKMTAMSASTRFLSMGLATTADEIATLTQMSLRLGDQTQSAGERIENFSLLLANQSIPRLDSFGISGAKVRERIAELQKATPGLSREIAFMNAVLEEGGDAMGKLGDAGLEATQGADRLAAATNNLKNALGEQFAPTLSNTQTGLAFVVNAFAETQAAINGATDGMGWFQKRIVIAAEGIDKLGGGLIEINTAFDDYAEAQASSVEMSERATNAALANAAAQVEELIPATTTAAESMDQYNMALAMQEDAATKAAVAQYDLANATAETQAATDAAAASISDLSAAQMAARQIEVLQQALDSGKITAEEFAIAQRELLMTSGDLTDAEIKAQSTIDIVTQSFIEGKISANEMAIAVNATRDSIESLQDKEVTIKINQIVTGTPSDSGIVKEARGVGDIGSPRETMAGGYSGTFSKPTNLLVGEAGKESVTVQPINSTTNNFNLNLTSNRSSESVQHDFNLMRAYTR